MAVVHRSINIPACWRGPSANVNGDLLLDTQMGSSEVIVLEHSEDGGKIYLEIDQARALERALKDAIRTKISIRAEAISD